MIKSVKDRGSWLFSQSWYIRNTSSMNKLYEMASHKRLTNEEELTWRTIG
jgi:hypothetical protein